MPGMTVVGQQMPISPLGADPSQLHAMEQQQMMYDNMVSAHTLCSNVWMAVQFVASLRLIVCNLGCIRFVVR